MASCRVGQSTIGPDKFGKFSILDTMTNQTREVGHSEVDQLAKGPLRETQGELQIQNKDQHRILWPGPNNRSEFSD